MEVRLQRWWSTKSDQKILLLRHGEIHGANAEKRFVGQFDVPLNRTGRDQARWWRQRMATVPLANIVSSDLRRCMQTARIAAADHLVPIEASSELREIDLGRWEGMRFAEVKQRWPDAFRQRGDDIARFRPPQGENFSDLHQRVVPFFENVVKQGGQHLLIVTHAGVIRILVCHMLGLPIENLLHIAQGYGAMNLIDRRGNRYRIQLLNALPGVP
jgi:probable phosphoglycerate mutase